MANIVSEAVQVELRNRGLPLSLQQDAMVSLACEALDFRESITRTVQTSDLEPVPKESHPLTY